MIHEVVFHGAKFKYDDGKVDPLSHNNTMVDEAVIREQYWNVKEGDVVVDVGAAWGSYTLTALALGANVIAIEPIDAIREELMRDVLMNGWENRCQFYSCAISNEPWPNPIQFTGSLAVPNLSPAYNTTQVRTLDDICLATIVDWIKIDVEANELNVLLGGVRTLRRFRPRLVIELHIGVDNLNQYMINNKIPERIRELLLDCRYRDVDIKVVPYLSRAFYIVG